MTLKEVKSPSDIKAFLNCVDSIYKNNKTYIRPLDKDVERIFDKKKNKAFRHGEICRWILTDSKGKTIGRVAAFINSKHSSQFPGVGGMGFFECIENKEAAFKLIDCAKEWLQNKGMKAMDGSINFGERDEFWGITVENYEQAPYYKQNFTPPYYKEYFEEYGFKVFFNQLVYHRKVNDKLQDKFEERANRLKADPNFTVCCIDKKNLDKYTEDFRSIYNAAWGKRDGKNFKGMSSAQAKSIMKTIKPILDERLLHYAYYKGEPIGFFIGLPEVNQLFKLFNGKFGLLEKLRFITLLKLGRIKTCFGTAFGVDPRFQGKGVEGLLFKNCSEVLIKSPYEDVIITWLGDFNGKMIHIIEQLGAKQIQKMATYRYIFDENETFERHPMV
ncbi:hypothetical protein [Luteibaculum oceani]|uniref:GNAT family N-acetyltransferase n=1 Tax=Luteibaculum oceani TaxID=1294296 RepID=A0A5C6UVC4_9FLAO|nr:hypothetical protein [Luteibaculum oceani]TXC76899.1 hypothetical protein FRX97_09795 [Luteibaculum oceani]